MTKCQQIHLEVASAAQQIFVYILIGAPIVPLRFSSMSFVKKAMYIEQKRLSISLYLSVCLASAKKTTGSDGLKFGTKG